MNLDLFELDLLDLMRKHGVRFAVTVFAGPEALHLRGTSDGRAVNTAAEQALTEIIAGAVFADELATVEKIREAAAAARGENN
jgi:hypothetical protein